MCGLKKRQRSLTHQANTDAEFHIVINNDQIIITSLYHPHEGGDDFKKNLPGFICSCQE